MIPPFEKRPSWLKSRGYLHITPKIDIRKRYEEILTKVQDENFVARHAFFPLLHSIIKERKFKKTPQGHFPIRAHSFREKGKIKKTAKQRPLHYATHIDSMIFGYYAEMILDLYEQELTKHPGLGNCVTAYRKIAAGEEEVKQEIISEDENEDADEQIEDTHGKGTVHFAFEAFAEIKKRSETGCIVLMFDIKSFFSQLDHDKLKQAWCNLFNVDRLDAAHFNVFKATTDFRYILRDDLR